MTIDQLPVLSAPDGSEAVPVTLNGADYKLPLKNIPVGGAVFDIVSIPANGSVLLGMAASSRGILFVTGTNARGIVFLTSNGQGSMTNSVAVDTANLTISASGLGVTVSNGGSGAASGLLITFAGKIEVVT